jgi:hypothetical protein
MMNRNSQEKMINKNRIPPTMEVRMTGNLLRKTVKNKITIKRKAMTMDQIATTTND